MYATNEDWRPKMHTKFRIEKYSIHCCKIDLINGSCIIIVLNRLHLFQLNLISELWTSSSSSSTPVACFLLSTVQVYEYMYIYCISPVHWNKTLINYMFDSIYQWNDSMARIVPQCTMHIATYTYYVVKWSNDNIHVLNAGD